MGFSLLGNISKVTLACDVVGIVAGIRECFVFLSALNPTRWSSSKSRSELVVWSLDEGL